MNVESAISLDKFCDYVPFVSTVTNIRDAQAKKKIKGFDANDEYVIHLYQKSWGRIALGCIPVIGNILLALSDLRGRLQSESHAIKVVQNDPVKFKTLSSHLRNNINVAEAALQATFYPKGGERNIDKESLKTCLFQFILERGGRDVRHSERLIKQMAENTDITMQIFRFAVYGCQDLAPTYFSANEVKQLVLQPGDTEDMLGIRVNKMFNITIGTIFPTSLGGFVDKEPAPLADPLFIPLMDLRRDIDDIVNTAGWVLQSRGETNERCEECVAKAERIQTELDKITIQGNEEDAAKTLETLDAEIKALKAEYGLN